MNRIQIKADQIQNDDELAERVGAALAELLHLKVRRNGQYLTSYGEKSKMGLARSVLTVIYQNSIGEQPE